MHIKAQGLHEVLISLVNLLQWLLSRPQGHSSGRLTSYGYRFGPTLSVASTDGSTTPKNSAWLERSAYF